MLKQIQDEIAELQMQQETLRELEFPLTVKRHQIIQQLLIEEKPFSDSTWELKLNYNGKVYLAYVGSRQDDRMDEVDKLCSKSWHDDFKLEEGFTLQFDDNQMSLSIKDVSQIAEFAKRHELTIQGSDISERAEFLRQELSGLETVCQQLGLKL
jgi:hypothetical protein